MESPTMSFLWILLAGLTGALIGGSLVYFFLILVISIAFMKG